MDEGARIIFQLAQGFGMAVLCGVIANHQKRENVAAWAIGGFFCGCLALIALFLTSAQTSSFAIAGTADCPKCGSLQTESSDGGAGDAVHVCNSCDHVWEG